LTAREEGFLLLTSHLGDPKRKPLTVAQLRTLTQRARQMDRPTQPRELETEDLLALGYDRAFAGHILQLLSQTEQLHWYLQRGSKSGCCPVTRVSGAYPALLRSRLAMEAPGTLWCKGDVSLLAKPGISLVGSRDLECENRLFAREAGRQAARQGLVLISGNARGADRESQEACLASGGCVVSVVADVLAEKQPVENVLYVAEDGYDQAFSAQRALSRNRIIHCLGHGTLVAQCTFGKGGTWDGTVKNLRRGWCPVLCFDDGSEAAEELVQLGAGRIGMESLQMLAMLCAPEDTLFDRKNF